MFEEIRQRVAEGRWEITGGWFLEPDCILPCGEAFVRQGLYAQRYLKSRFGRLCTIGSNVDSFGHNHVLPQILKKAVWIRMYLCGPGWIPRFLYGKAATEAG